MMTKINLNFLPYFLSLFDYVIKQMFSSFPMSKLELLTNNVLLYLKI